MPHDRIVTPHLEPQRYAQLARLAQQLDHQLDHPSGQPQPMAQSGLLEQLGSALWDASGLEADTLRTALDEASADQQPLRLLIQGEQEQRLPWELLYHPHPELGFVAQHPWCGITRRLRPVPPRPPQQTARPLRLLLCVASPEDLDAERSRLDFEREEELLFTALDRPLAQGSVDINVTPDGCVETLLEHLQQQTYHAVILSLHGTPARPEQAPETWGLAFEAVRTGRTAPVTGSVLAAHLDRLPRGHRPGLMLLSACRSARADESAAAMASVAETLHRRGVERVLGMRLSVLDAAASVFAAGLFQRLAQGEDVGRAVTLARLAVAEGTWWQGQTAARHKAGDPWAQWSVPVLFDRTQDGPLLDLTQPMATPPPPRVPTLVPGDGSLRLPARGAFIGRRREIRQYLRAFVDGLSPRLLLTGPGGVGKTTLAGLFARALAEEVPETRLLGLQAPFQLTTLHEILWPEAFDGTEEPALLPTIQAEPDLRTRLRRMLQSLARRARPCAFVLDNLESIQEIASLSVPPEHADSLWLVQQICALPAPTRVLLTGRYAWHELPAEAVRACPVPDAPYGDVLRRMQRLDWPASMSGAEKRQMYAVLGGNHRAIEWAAQLLKQAPQHQHLIAALAAQQAAPGTPHDVARVVVEAMRQHLLFTRLREALTPAQDHVLRATALYRVPVTEDGLLMLTDQAPAQCAADSQRLEAYALLERGHDAELELDYLSIPPVVRGLLGAPSFSPDVLPALHQRMGRYHRFQGAQVSRRWSDDVEAIYHFRKAGEHLVADELAAGVVRFYYGISNYITARTLTEEIVQRVAPLPPWWALNNYGACQLRLGMIESALAAFERALPLVPTRRDEGITLNNLSRIARAKGNSTTAVQYLEASLAIQRDIGDKAGEGTTLNNLSQVARTRGDYAMAVQYLEASLAIQRDIGDKTGEGTALNNLGELSRLRGDYGIAMRHLEGSLAIWRAIGDKAGEATTLNNLSLSVSAQGDYATAVQYLEASLAIQRAIGDKAEEATTLNNLSVIASARGDYATAVQYLEASLAIQRALGNKTVEGTTLNNLGVISRTRGDYATAVQHLEASLVLHRAIGDKAGEGTTLNNLGELSQMRGDLAMAVQYLEASLAIQRALGNKAGEGALLNNLSQFYSSRGDNVTEVQYLEASLAIRRAIGDKAGMAVTLYNMGHISWQAEETEQALTQWTEAYTLAMELGEALILFRTAAVLGKVRAQAGALAEARHFLSQAVEVGKAAGFPEVQKVEEALRRLPAPEPDTGETP